jgi:hypothetical protein
MNGSFLEYILKQDDQLCFVRIPKTGSTTLISILDAQFNHEELCPVLVADVPQSSTSELAKYRLFRDHFDYDLRDYLLKPPIYITMLRHPLDRAISYYEFCKRGQNQTPFANYMRAATEAGLRDFTCNPDPTIRIRNSNLQTRQIAAGLDSRHRDPFQAAAIESQLSDSELITLAKAHLKEFKFVGLTERFQDSTLLLSYIFGWYPLVEYQSLRVASKKLHRDQLDQETIDAILEANQLDLQLYEEAQNIFEQQFSQMRRELLEEYASQQSLQISDDSVGSDRQTLLPLLEQHYERRYAERNLQSICSLDYSFLQSMSGTGWHRLNGAYSGLQCTSTPFRWTGPGTESTLDFPLVTDADLIIKFRLVNAVTPDVLASLTLKVNDHPVPLTTQFRQGNITVFQGVISQTILTGDRSFTRLTFNVNRTVSLQTVYSESPDQRVVGLAFHRIQIIPASAKPGDQEYLYLLFPWDDLHWVEAADFLDRHLQPTETFAAPSEFYERFPQQFQTDTSPFLPDQPAWVVVHKGLAEEIDSDSLKWTTRNLIPVFANAVFVIFTNRLDVQKLSDRSPHLQAFWAIYPLPFPVKIWQKIKAFHR